MWEKVLGVAAAFFTLATAILGLSSVRATNERNDSQDEVKLLRDQNSRLQRDNTALASELSAVIDDRDRWRRRTTKSTVSDAPTSQLSEPPSGASPDRTAIGVNWTTDAGDYQDRIGQVIAFDCPRNGIAQEIWGTDLYTYDSPVCSAAVHAGEITLKDGGRALIRIREGAEEYIASERNGIVSQEYGSYCCSYEFVH